MNIINYRISYRKEVNVCNYWFTCIFQLCGKKYDKKGRIYEGLG